MALDLMPPEQLEAVATRFRLLGDPTRLALLNVLHACGEMPVQALADATGTTHANASKHLRLLDAGGLVARRPDGPFVYYRIADPMLAAVCTLVCSAVPPPRRDVPPGRSQPAACTAETAGGAPVRR
ncbi:MAG: ArsR/SmtB family transcription factor [Rubricoccaceae bacterium]